MLGRILNATLFNNFLKLEGLQGSPPPLLNLGLPLPPISLDLHPNTKTARWNLGLTPRPHFFEGELIHWVDKAKSVWIIVGQLLIKAGWWDAPLVLQGFSRNIASTLNYKNSKIRLSHYWSLTKSSQTILKRTPDHIVLHVDTNVLVSDQPPNLIVKSIWFLLVWKMKTMMSLFLTSYTSWSFQGKSKWGKWLFIRTLHGKKIFNWPLENFENFTTEWK